MNVALGNVGWVKRSADPTPACNICWVIADARPNLQLLRLHGMMGGRAIGYRRTSVSAVQPARECWWTRWKPAAAYVARTSRA